MRLALVVGVFFVLTLPLSAALNFNSGNLGTVGIENTIFLFTPTGGTGPYVFSYTPSSTPIPNFRVINAPELPSYATAQQTGGLVGIPLTAGVQNTMIRLTDSGTGQFIDKAVSFTVVPVDIVGFGPTYYSIGDTVSQVFWPVGGTPPYSYTLSGSLPPGLSLATEAIGGQNVAVVTGVISNTANTATTSASNGYNFTISIKDSASNVRNRGYSMVVSAMQLAVNGMQLNSGTNRNLPNASVGLAYSEQITVMGGTPPYSFGLLPLNAPPTPLALSQNGLISGMPTGSNFGGRFTITVTDSASPSHYMTARVAIKILPTIPLPLSFSTNTVNDSPVGSNFTDGIYATGGLPPYTFDVEPSGPLPAGAYLVQGPQVSPDTWDPDPGYIRAGVQTPGTYTFTLGVTDSAGNKATRAFTMNVPSLSAYYIYSNGIANSNTPLSDLTIGTPYSRYLIPLGGMAPYTTTPVNIPFGLSVNNADLLSGTPLEAGQYLSLLYTLSDSANNSFTTNGNVTIASTTTPGLTLSGGDFGYVQAGGTYSTNLVASGSAQNPPVFTVTQVAGTIPPGLKLLTGPDFNNGGNVNVATQLAGIPNAPGVYTFVYRVVDGLGQVGEREVKLHVSGISVVNTAFAPATVGVPYNQTIDVRGGTPPYKFSLTTGNLPPGLNFDTTTGTISGMPQSTNSTSVTIQIQDSAGDTLLRSYTLNIYPIQITGPSILPNATLYANYSYSFAPSPAGSYTYTITGQPAGLSINANTGVLSGISTGAGIYAITVTAYNNGTGAVVVRSFTLFVINLSAVPIINGLPTLEFGGMNVPYLGDVLVGTNTVFTLGVGGGGVPPYTITLVPPSTLPPGLALAIGSNYQGTTNFGRWVLAGTPTAPGLYTFTLRYADTSGITEDRLVALNVTGLGLATTAPSAGVVNQPYSAQLYGTGGNGTYSFALVNESYLQENLMPPGLTLSPAGLISGTPTSTGAFGTFIQVTSGTSVRRLTISITINATANGNTITFALGPIAGLGVVGRGTDIVLTPTGGAGVHTWSLVSGALPPGMRLLTGNNLPSGFSPPTAVIAGAAATPGIYRFRVRVDDSAGNFGIRDAEWEWDTMRIGPINDPFTANLSLPPATVGAPYSFSTVMINGLAPVTFTTDIGTYLPPGMTLNAAGVLGGTPTAAGPFVFYYHATDANGNVHMGQGSVSVYPANRAAGMNLQAGNGTLLPVAAAGGAYAFTLNQLLSTGYGTPPIVWTVYGGTILPPGLSITPPSGPTSATLAGTATTPGNYFFSLLATDANSNTAILYDLELIVSALSASPPAGNLPPAIAGTSYQTTITASGGTPPYAFSPIYYSDMPAGLSLSSSGVLSGTPSVAGPFILTLLVTDAANNVSGQIYTLNVSPAGTVTPAFTLDPSSINLSYTVGDPAPAPIPVSVGSTSTPLIYSVSTSGGSWLTAAPISGATPGSTNLTINPLGPVPLTAGTYNATATFASAAASNSPATIPVTLTVNNALVCTYSVSPPVDTILNVGGTKTISIAVPSPSCNWSVDPASVPAWIAIQGASSGSGNGTITLNVAANTANPPTAERSAQISINGSSYSLTEFGTSCQFSLQPSSSNVVAAGGSGPVSVTASSAGCAWSSSTNPQSPWISFSGPTSGSGNGAVSVVVQPNGANASRGGTVTIANQTYTVNQAGLNCNYSLSSNGNLISYSGGGANFTMTAPQACAWTVNSGPSWVSVTSPSPASGSGNGAVALSIAPNSTTAGRQANVQIGGQIFQVTQAGVPCGFSLSANNPVQPSGGGMGSVDIATNAGCQWTASSSAGFLTPAANSGTGSMTLNFAVGANSTGNARNASLTIAGQSITVTQSGPVCAYSLQSASANVPGGGGAGSVNVATANGCGPWTATSNATWLHITSSGPYNGPVSASYSVDPNLTGSQLFGTLTIAGQTFSVTEGPLQCPVTLGASSQAFGQFGGTNGQFTYTTAPPGCTVNVQSLSSWITLTNLSTPGTVKFSADPNTYGTSRSGTVMVGDQSFTVTEAPSTCAYTLTIFSSAFGRLGGNGGVPVTVTPAQCGPPAVGLNDPAMMITLGSAPGADGVFTQDFSVGIYQSFVNYVRTAQLLVNGQFYTVKQTSW
jgi:large repetitive protein